MKELVSTISLAKSFLAMGNIEMGTKMAGENLKKIADGEIKDRDNRIFAQISESRVGRAVRTEEYLFSVFAPNINGGLVANADIYEGDFLYDLKQDPFELNNLIDDPSYSDIRKTMEKILIEEMIKAGEEKPLIKYCS